MLEGSDFGSRMAINGAGDKLYYSFLGNIYMHDINSASAFTSDALISKTCYALGIDPLSGEIYFSDPIDYAQPGIIYRYDASGSTLLDSVSAGIIPGTFLFLN